MGNDRIKKAIFIILFIFVAISQLHAGDRIIVAEVEGIIDPFVAKYVERVIDKAEEKNAECVIFILDTPGGLDPSMRTIVKKILSSKVPVITYVSPTGARCASAGVFISLASDIIAMTPGTNIGAAHPVDMQGKSASDKITNDASAYIKSIAQKKGKNYQWAEDTVRKSISFTAMEAYDSGIINFIANNLDELLTKLEGVKIVTDAGEKTLKTKGLAIEVIPFSARESFMHIIANPNIAYILFLLGIYGLIYELASPGAIFPGVIGGICIVMALVAFESLPVSIAGIVLLVLAVSLFILEIKIISHGILTVGGIISLVLGSLLLYTTKSPYIRVSIMLIIVMTAVTVAFFVFVLYFVVKAHRRKLVSGTEELIGKTGIVKTELSPEGIVHIDGEEWTAYSDGSAIGRGEKVEVESVEGIRVKVKKI